MAGMPRRTRSSATIGLVYTPPEYRKRGYAADLVASLSTKFLEDGFSMCVLHTELNNPGPQRIYQKIGYKKACEFLELKFS